MDLEVLDNLPDSRDKAEDWVLRIVPLAVGREAVVHLVGQAGAVVSGALVLNNNQLFKGTVPRDFRLQVFYMDQFPPSL